jgi:DNA-binding CsgD family transcriptional regulator
VSARWRAATDRVERICAGDGDARERRADLLDQIRRVVGFDAHAWLLTDPVTCVGAAPLADVPSLADLPRLIRLKYLTGVNRWTSLPEGRAVTLVEATGGELSRSLVWRELLSRYDVSDVASIVFRDRGGCWGFLDLWRRGGSAFTAEEQAFLGGVVPSVTGALRRSMAATFAQPNERAGDRWGPVVLLLSGELTALSQTPQTEHYLRSLLPTEQDRSPIPANAYNVAAQLLAVEEGVDAHPASVRTHLSGGRWVSLRAARMADPPGRAAPIAVTIEQTEPLERAEVYALALGLTQRESEVVRHLIAGEDTRSVARRMGVSEHTVNDHLKSAFAKSGTNSRRQLIARASGTGHE